MTDQAMTDARKKRCSRCREVLPVDMFYRRGSGFQAFCKSCSKAYSAEWRSANPDKVAAGNRRNNENNPGLAERRLQWARDNPEKMSAYRRKHYESNRERIAESRRVKRYSEFGYSEGDYERMMLEQGGRCKICDRDSGTGKQSLHVDHCESAGKIRGLLCGSCNRAIGLLGHNYKLIAGAAMYVRQSC